MRKLMRATGAVVACGLLFVGCGDDEKSNNANNVNNSNNVNNVNNINNVNNVNNVNNSNNLNNEMDMGDDMSVDPETCYLHQRDNGNNGTVNATQKVWYRDGDLTKPYRYQDRSSFLTNVNEYAVNAEYDDAGNLTRQEVDLSNDGSIDWVFVLTWTEYGEGDDAMWQQTRQEFDNDGDGDAESVIVITYTEDGKFLERTVDGIIGDGYTVADPADGTVDARIILTYNANGDVLTQFHDEDADGTYELEYTWAYDTMGNLTRFTQDGVSDLGQSETVEAADGTLNLEQVSTYDNLGRLTGTMVDGRVFWSCIPVGSQTSFRAPDCASSEMPASISEPVDGTPDYVRRNFEYDGDNIDAIAFEEDGRRDVWGRVWTVANGTFDRSFDLVVTRDTTNSDIILAFSGKLDEDMDGDTDAELKRTFNALGNLVRQEIDGVLDNSMSILTAADGTFQDTIDVTYLADSETRTSYKRDVDNDGNLDVDGTWTYMDFGGEVGNKLLILEGDGRMGADQFEFIDPPGPADGIIDYRWTYTYNDEGNTLTYIEERPNDQGVIETNRSDTWDYDDCENLTF